MTQVVEYKACDGIAYITLNRPNNMNSLNLDLGNQLSAALTKCFDPAIRVVVITGEGKAFCAGGDLGYMQSAPTFSQALDELTIGLNRAVTDIRLLPKPVIAAVNGVAAGAGMSIALACDLRIASDKAKFKQAYTTSALVPDGGWTLWVPRILGLAKATELLLWDEIIPADKALEFGLVNKVVAADELQATVDAEAKRLTGFPTKAFAEAKALLNSSMLHGFETQLEQERQGMIRAGATEDVAEGVSAFFAKRSPNFVGR